MATLKRVHRRIVGDVEGQAIAATLGGQVAAGRKRLKISQEEFDRRVGVKASRISQIERGEGQGSPLGLWIAIGLALGRPLAVALSRPVDVDHAPADAGHLEIQEFLLRLARKAGRRATFELATRPNEPWRSTDVGVRDNRQRVLILEEAWNTFGDVGAARRATTRKVGEAEALALAIGGEGPYRVASVWVVRSSAANRALIARFPEVFASACPGSSQAWVRSLLEGTPPPSAAGLVWVGPASGRLFAWRRRQRTVSTAPSGGAAPRAAPQ
jgi:transcriptional regulator with XRE-family HTH domain